jgi:hypothetical protein
MAAEGLPWTNALAYYVHSQIRDVKYFITLCPGAKVKKIFYDRNFIMFKKARVFVLYSNFQYGLMFVG